MVYPVVRVGLSADLNDSLPRKRLGLTAHQQLRRAPPEYFWHALSSLLLFAALRRATDAPGLSAFAAFLFALHPLHVQSVAWVSELKDVLSAFFFLAALLAYLAEIQAAAGEPVSLAARGWV